MDFGLTDEQRSIVRGDARLRRARALPARGGGRAHRRAAARARRSRSGQKAIAAGLYAANMPEEVGGAGLDTVTWVLFEKELGRANYALHYLRRPALEHPAGRHRGAARALPLPLRPRRAARLPGDDRAGRRLRPARDAHARGARRRRLADQRHQALHQPRRRVRLRDPVRAPTGSRTTPAARRCRRSWSTWTPRARRCTTATATSRTAATPTRSSTSTTAGCPADALLGEEGKGFDLAGTWLGSTRLQVAATCLGRAERALDLAVRHAAEREQFGQTDRQVPGRRLQARRHGDRAAGRRAADAATPPGSTTRARATDADIAMAKLKATEMLAMVADEAIQIHGGMGLMDELPLERIWRDARIERIWDGTSRDPAAHHLARRCCARWEPER